MLITIPSGRSKARGELEPEGRASYIIHAAGSEFYVEWAGPLSLKSFYRGRVLYNAGAGCFAVDDRAYLLLNRGQPYSLTIDAERPVESFCIFFATGLVEEVLRSATTRAELLLDDPEPPADPDVTFVERLYPHDDLVTPLLARLRGAIARGFVDRAWIEEQLHEILLALLEVRGGVFREMERLPAVRAATRDELYRRLYRARDYAAAAFDGPVTLEELSRAACLSPNHLLRNFKQLFGRSPHQYLTALRIERAKDLLAGTDLSVLEVCLSVGFESLGSFTTLFHRSVGLSPGAWRRQKR